MGTGAFSVASADRIMNVDTVADENAYLSLTSESKYASESSGGLLELQFDGSNDQRGDGLNKDADTEFRNVFSITNNGTNDIRVQFYESGQGLNDLLETPVAIAVSDEEIFYDGDTQINDIETVNTTNSPGHWPGDGNPAVAGAQDVEAGETIYVHVGFFLNGNNETLGEGVTTDPSDIPDGLTVYAEALPETGAL